MRRRMNGGMHHHSWCIFSCMQAFERSGQLVRRSVSIEERLGLAWNVYGKGLGHCAMLGYKTVN